MKPFFYYFLSFLFGLSIAFITLLLFSHFMVKNQANNNVNIPKASPTQVMKKQLQVRAAIPYWDQANAVTSFKENVDLVDYVSLFWYYIDSEGNIEKYDYAFEDPSIIDFAHQNNIKVSAVITNLPEVGTWDSERVENVIKDDASTANHIKDIESLIAEKNFDGVTIDYESVNSTQEQNFSKFVKRLSESLRPRGKYVEVALHPKTGGPNDSRYTFQNWKTISKYADRVYIMAFGEHYDEGKPGPVASIEWTRLILSYADKQAIPITKLFLGLPLYGYDWDKDSDEPARGLTFSDVQSLIQREGVEALWDGKSASSYFEYNDSHEVWFENAKSVEEKVKLAKEFGLAGITFWRLGGEDPQVWQAIGKNKK